MNDACKGCGEVNYSVSTAIGYGRHGGRRYKRCQTCGAFGGFLDKFKIRPLTLADNSGELWFYNAHQHDE